MATDSGTAPHIALFRRLGERTAEIVGKPAAFIAACTVVIAWALSGPLFHFSDTWQLVINTGTTIVTFLMVFLIQGTQNRDTRILNLKLDELLRAVHGARNAFVNLNDLSDEDLAHLQNQFRGLGARASPLIGDDLAAVEDELARRGRKSARKPPKGGSA